MSGTFDRYRARSMVRLGDQDEHSPTTARQDIWVRAGVVWYLDFEPLQRRWALEAHGDEIASLMSLKVSNMSSTAKSALADSSTPPALSAQHRSTICITCS